MALTAAEEKELQRLLESEENSKCSKDSRHFITQYVKIEDRDEAIPDLPEDSPEEQARMAQFEKEYKEDPEATTEKWYSEITAQTANKVDTEKPDGIAIPFTLWPGQLKVLIMFLTCRLLIVLKARQLGLSWLSLAYAVWRIIYFPGYQVVALSKREDDAKELVRRVKFILKHLPDFIIQEKKKASPDWNGPTWEATALNIMIYHPNDQEPAVFNSMSSGPDSGRSFTANLVILDEWAFQQWAQEIWSAAFPTINRPTGGQVIGISTAKRLTLYEEIWNRAVAGKNKFKTVFLGWKTDPRRTQEWYEETKQNLPSSYLQEYPSTPEEAFSAGEGTAFPEFDPDIHVCEPFTIPEHWRRWKCLDNGYDDPFYWGWLTVSETGKVYLYREFTRDREDPKLAYSDQARKVVELNAYSDIEGSGVVEQQEPCDFIVAGLDAWSTHHRDQTGKCLIDYYMEGGATGFIPAITDRKLRKAVWHEYLRPYKDENTGKMTAKLQIFSTCKSIIETLPKLPKDEKDPEKVADCAIDHPYDSIGYGLIAYNVEKSKGLPEEKSDLAKLKDQLARQNMRYRRRLT